MTIDPLRVGGGGYFFHRDGIVDGFWSGAKLSGGKESLSGYFTVVLELARSELENLGAIAKAVFGSGFPRKGAGEVLRDS